MFEYDKTLKACIYLLITLGLSFYVKHKHGKREITWFGNYIWKLEKINKKYNNFFATIFFFVKMNQETDELLFWYGWCKVKQHFCCYLLIFLLCE